MFTGKAVVTSKGSTSLQSPAEGCKLTTGNTSGLSSGVSGEIRILNYHRQPDEEQPYVVGITGQATNGITNLHAPTKRYN